IVWNTVPVALGVRANIFKPIIASRLIVLIPAVECAARYIQLGQYPLDRQGGFFNQANDLIFLGGTRAHQSSHSPFSVAVTLFFSTRFFKNSSATTCFICSFPCRKPSPSPLLACRLVSPVSRALPASRNS